MALEFDNNLNFPSNLTGLTDIINSNLSMTDQDQKKIEDELIGTIHENKKINYEDELNHAFNEVINENNNDKEDLSKIDNYYEKSTLSKDSNYLRRTEEEKKQQHISNVIKTMNKDNKYDDFSIEKEREDDDKIILIEQIDNLRDVLETDNVKLNKIPSASLDMPIRKLREIKKILTLKNDRQRLCIAAEEIILSIVNLIEYVFNGERDFFGMYPDLVGWPSTVRQKLRRMRPETSMMVSDFMRQYKINGTSRLLIELVPSMFLYSKSRYNHRKNKGSNNNKDYAYNDAIQKMDDFH